MLLKEDSDYYFDCFICQNVDVNEMINTDERIHFPFSVQEVANRMIIIVAMTK